MQVALQSIKIFLSNPHSWVSLVLSIVYLIFITGNAAPAPNEYLIRGAYDKFKRAYDMRGPHITFRDHRDPEHG